MPSSRASSTGSGSGSFIGAEAEELEAEELEGAGSDWAAPAPIELDAEELEAETLEEAGVVGRTQEASAVFATTQSSKCLSSKLADDTNTQNQSG